MKIRNEYLLLIIIIFSSIWASYLIIDKVNHKDVPRLITERDYGSKFVFAFEGETSFIEEITFGMVSPAISCFMMIDYVRSIEKNEPKRKRTLKEDSKH